MKKVKEYLDNILYRVGESSWELKNNGHFCVHGHWEYPENWHAKMSYDDFAKLTIEERQSYKTPDHISITINNETIIVGNISADDVWSRYHYLQTYQHIPRGEADEWGYYARSTEDEYYNKIKNNEIH